MKITAPFRHGKAAALLPPKERSELERGVVAILTDLLSSFLVKWRRARWHRFTFVHANRKLYVDAHAWSVFKRLAQSDWDLYSSIIDGDPKLRQLIRERIDEITTSTHVTDIDLAFGEIR